MVLRKRELVVLFGVYFLLNAFFFAAFFPSSDITLRIEPVQYLPEVIAQATSVTKNGITWTFGGDYEVGTYITGDYWVKENSAGQGVIITSTTPS